VRGGPESVRVEQQQQQRRATAQTRHGRRNPRVRCSRCTRLMMHVTASGAIDWAVDWAIQTGGTSSSQGLGIAYDGAGGALVTGYFYGEASFGSTSLTSRGMQDAFVMHVAASGAMDWAIQGVGGEVCVSRLEAPAPIR